MKLAHPAVGDIRRYNWQDILLNVETLGDFEDALMREWEIYKETLEIDPESQADIERGKQEKNKYAIG